MKSYLKLSFNFELIRKSLHHSSKLTSIQLFALFEYKHIEEGIIGDYIFFYNGIPFTMCKKNRHGYSTYEYMIMNLVIRYIPY